MITVVSVVYSILLVALTFTSAQFSPRVLVAFVDDRVSQTTLGIFVGTFAYCLPTLPAIRGGPAPFVPSIAVVGAMALAIGCMACLLYFIHHIAGSIQAGHIVDRIARETEQTLDQVFPFPLNDVPPGIEPGAIPPGMPVLSSSCGYIRAVDETGLLATAQAHGVTLRVDRSIGQFVSEGTPFLDISTPGHSTAALEAACRHAFDIGPVRTMEQDVEFGVLQIVDIALKAISPAVNDPTTATTCVDQLGRILLRASLRSPPNPVLRDPDGPARVVLRRTSFPRLLDVAFSQIRHYGKADVAVPLRMMRGLGELAAASRHAPHSAAILDQARRLAAACERGFPDDDRADLDERLGAVERSAAASKASDPARGHRTKCAECRPISRIQGRAMSLTDSLFGWRVATDEEGEQRVGVWAGIPMLGLDALGTASYGPEAALTLLIPLGAAGVSYIGPISTLIILLLAVVYFSYRQTIAAYPHGGGSYTVARENLGTTAGLLAAAALMLDYVLVVAVGISAGIGALVSALPSIQPFTLPLCLATLAMITVVNLRGVHESGLAFAVPTYLFVASMLAVIAIGIVKTIIAGGRPTPMTPPQRQPAAEVAASLWLLMRAFASGCMAMTGVEAISNGVGAFREPTVPPARRTQTAIITLLGVMLAGIAYLCHSYGIGATEPGRPGCESVLSQLVGAVVGKGASYYVTIGSVLAVLALSANTGFADFPRLCRVVAQDGYLPNGFAHRGRRLVYSQGIIVLAMLSAALLIAFGGVTDNLIPLFAVGAFLAFTLSQAGMVVHWRRAGGPHSGKSMAINAAGAACTAVTLVVVLVSKFLEGAWVMILLIPALLALFTGVHAHYRAVAREVATDIPLDACMLEPPLALVPIRGWSGITRKALRFALKISPEVYALRVADVSVR